MGKKDGWYYSTDSIFDGHVPFKYMLDSEVEDYEYRNFSEGPFKTITMAKNDAKNLIGNYKHWLSRSMESINEFKVGKLKRSRRKSNENGT